MGSSGVHREADGWMLFISHQHCMLVLFNCGEEMYEIMQTTVNRTVIELPCTKLCELLKRAVIELLKCFI